MYKCHVKCLFNCLIILTKCFSTLIGSSSNILDAVFVVGSHTREDFEKAKNSILSTVNTQTTSNPNFGVILYDRSIAKAIPIDQFTSLDEFKSQVKSLMWRSPGILVENGFDAGRKMLVEDGRPLARKLLVVFTDKHVLSNTTDLEEVVQATTDDDIKIVTVFFGLPDDPTKMSILTPGDPEPSVIQPSDDGTESGPDVATKVFKGVYLAYWLCLLGGVVINIQ